MVERVYVLGAEWGAEARGEVPVTLEESHLFSAPRFKDELFCVQTVPGLLSLYPIILSSSWIISFVMMKNRIRKDSSFKYKEGIVWQSYCFIN